MKQLVHGALERRDSNRAEKRFISALHTSAFRSTL